MNAAQRAERRRSPVGEVAAVFGRLGVLAFGGPAAHIAMMQDEVVERRRWLSRNEFLDLLAVTSLLPGPNSTEMAIILGYRRAGPAGLLAAGVCFILPAAVIVAGFAWGYQRYHALPEVGAVLYGVKPVIIAVILQAVWSLGKTALRSKTLMVVGGLAAVLHFRGVNELVLLFGCAALTALWRWGGEKPRPSARPLVGLAAVGAALIAVPMAVTRLATGSTEFGLVPLFAVFAKIGSILYGSGYVLLAFLQADLVHRLHWLTPAQLLDAVAVGQVTPGPVFTTATFIGYLLGGGWGAVVATMGIFLPSFALVAIGERLVTWLRRSLLAAAFLDGLVAASLGLMAAVAVEFGREAVVDPLTAVLAVAGVVLLVRRRVSATWLILAGAVAGLLAGPVGLR